MNKILITGSAGFIGYHLAKKLLSNGNEVVGVDNLNSYYDKNLKLNRLKSIKKYIKEQSLDKNYKFFDIDLLDLNKLKTLFANESFDIVINLAAQAGVRYSLKNPQTYIDSNISGFNNILECCKDFTISHLLFASSSSVYGLSKSKPFSTLSNTDYPISIYAASKKCNELQAHSYSHLYNIPCTGLRFFTVYGPFGRPDMAYFKFTKAILDNQIIEVYDKENMKRDFTYIDDVTEAISLIIPHPPKSMNSKNTFSISPYKIYNIGNNNPITLSRFITSIENSLGIKAKEKLLPIQPGDVQETYADIDDLADNFNFIPSTSIEVGMQLFVNWYLKYFNANENKV